jgi:hypothetical protein
MRRYGFASLLSIVPADEKGVCEKDFSLAGLLMRETTVKLHHIR